MKVSRTALAASTSIMHEGAAMKRSSIMQSLFQSIEYKAACAIRDAR
jgi:hypothetical protein